MKTLCYYLFGDFRPAIAELENLIPCWVWIGKPGEETTVYCREEDVALVECTLADYV